MPGQRCLIRCRVEEADRFRGIRQRGVSDHGLVAREAIDARSKSTPSQC